MAAAIPSRSGVFRVSTVRNLGWPPHLIQQVPSSIRVAPFLAASQPQLGSGPETSAQAGMSFNPGSMVKEPAC
jgi:hypothetical protein